MSLWCGSCRTEIFEGFGLLYKLERCPDGKLKYPDEKKDYVPANSAICNNCWSRLPDTMKLIGDESGKKLADAAARDLFLYAPADSNNDTFWGSKTWSGIEASNENLVFIMPQTVKDYFPRAEEIIRNMARSRSG